MSRKTNPAYFGAGPAVLPTKVLEQASKDLLLYLGNPVGVSEISHRSKDASDIINSTKENLVKLMNIPSTHEVFFLQGGGTGGFAAVATNLMSHYAGVHKKAGKAGYVITGSWSKKAYQEATRLGLDTEVITDLGKYDTVAPVSEWKEMNKDETAYIYYCDNETVNGIEFVDEFPFDKYQGIEIVADVSSDFLSKELDVSKYGIIYGGAQKNIGIAGISVYIIKKSLLENNADVDLLRKLQLPVTPIVFDFPTVVKNNSAYNTIPIFNLHVLNLVLKNLLEKTLKKQEEENNEKALLLYNTLDKYSKIYNVPVDKKWRSRMNVVFTLNKELQDEFLKEAANLDLTGLKGHRSVGGIRASLYNAVDLSVTEKLNAFVKEFAEKRS